MYIYIYIYIYIYERARESNMRPGLSPRAHPHHAIFPERSQHTRQSSLCILFTLSIRRYYPPPLPSGHNASA